MDNWKKNLGDLFGQKEEQKALEKEKVLLEGQRHIDIRKELSEFISSIIKPAFEELKTELEKYNRRVKILKNDRDGLICITIIVEYDTSTPVGFKYTEEFIYTIIVNFDTEVCVDYKYTENKIIKEEMKSCFINSEEDSNIYNISKDDIINNFMDYYEKFI